MAFYGHSLPDRDPCDWEPLEDHLELVTEYANAFAGRLQAEPWGRLLGYWHDLGKYDARFQDYLLRENGFEAHLEETARINHSTFGGQYACRQFTGQTLPFGYLLAYCILGHHAGLPDYRGADSDPQKASSLALRLTDPTPQVDLGDVPEHIRQTISLNPPQLTPASDRALFQISFWARMLFSCLVDADYLATEQFMTPERHRSRSVIAPQWTGMQARLQQLLDSKSQVDSPLTRIRREILEACLTAADLPAGFFSLTVPTGGGKTLASLAFALKHLLQTGKERIIYAIPFTSIVEQTAAVFRDVLGDLADDSILEHHCNVDPERERLSSRLATENWDAPLVVTTNVQLLESLFAARPSRCRKLHRIANSVIILDEAQTLPVEFLKPCLFALQELVTNYGCTVVLCTATQPAIALRDDFPIGLENVREIIPSPADLATRMKRVEVQSLGPVSQGALVDRLGQHAQFLCIVNYKADASNLFRLLQQQSADDGLFHLSTNLCAEHRFQKLREIRVRLAAGQPCRVISTQLIEAGVDVDFPVVYRALAGLDSIAQAAGRCNREGKRNTADVFVFEPEGENWMKPRGYQGRTAGITRGMLRDQQSQLHQHGWLATETISAYFRENYWSHEDLWDKQNLLTDEMLARSSAGIPEFQFREIAAKFRLIDDYLIPVFVRFDEKANELLDGLRANLLDPDRKAAGLQRRQLLRKLQRYAVGVNERLLKEMLGRDISVLPDMRGEPTDFYELVNDNCYDNHLGFHAGNEGMLSESQTIL
ncbi:CRISPR-associated helicase/endonuclease Cas3 [Rubinisphaera brasiliensis]|uniref:CRISPR-associated HD domain protein n=1 Tax=Rubinisphaera brasiliensis (strain ATCC 49424 / DSM 5305 / JCM 21570 / IAM 15109 / NBRC 103401 / IFAM 1448) TaxID=756272 RepID=F0SHD8_RUBBR|nr:CRISPR-associated helicase/endonuclease Cas3 [Rubinisphaera brasiliensis]ADY61452.1 CRISPR-associated HD domain protein [Rubinisphaera brasiliensis DSM 5305]ADY61693.1 CRISPR-associated HD domain protein [Rubinisphaera brasiliensis DSM 5305]